MLLVYVLLKLIVNKVLGPRVDEGSFILSISGHHGKAYSVNCKCRLRHCSE